MTSENNNEQAATHLYQAVINCGHEIDRDKVVLYFDSKQPGHNALNQLNRRLSAAHQALATLPMECGLSPRELLKRSQAMEAALMQIIEMNQQWAQDQWGDRNKAESMACVKTARAALAKHKEV